MNIKRKNFFILIVGLAFAVLFYLTPFTVKAASSNTVKLYLNHSTYVYNSNGIRLRGKGNYIKKNKVIVAPGTLKQTNTVKRYYTMKTVTSPSQNQETNYLYWLPYKVIKGQEYYCIGKSKYIKCINVNAINTKDNDLFTNYATVTISQKPWHGKHVYAKNNDGKDTSKILKPKSKVVIDDDQFLGHQIYSSYHIKGTKYWVFSGDVEKAPRAIVTSHPTKIITNNKIINY